jgi:hypothetical protein
MCSGKVIGYLDFSCRGVFIGEGASSGVGRGNLTRKGRSQGPGCAALLCEALVAPLCLIFGSLEAPVKFWATGFGFVQFREYFLCKFSETQKQQKTGNCVTAWNNPLYRNCLFFYFCASSCIVTLHVF